MNSRVMRSKSTLFLIELILAIGIFAAASAICIRLFVGAHLTGERSEAVTHALYTAVGAAEAFKAAGGEPAHMAEILSAEYDGFRVLRDYDADWLPTEVPDAAAYRLSVLFGFENGVAEAIIRVNDRAGDTLYSLTAKEYVGAENPGGLTGAGGEVTP